jgi:glycyl-tRNA synthetase beta chain
VSEIGAAELSAQLLAFFGDRLKIYLRERGARYDLIDAIFALPMQDDLALIMRRVNALGGFLDAEAGANLLVGYRRAANILRAEEKKSSAEETTAFEDDYARSLLLEPEEWTLADLLDPQDGVPGWAEPILNEDFQAAMAALAKLRAPVDRFFDKVTVNTPEPELRLNRLRLLARLRRAVNEVADLSRVAG